MRATPLFGLVLRRRTSGVRAQGGERSRTAQGHESPDVARDRELVERPFEWWMSVFQQPVSLSVFHRQDAGFVKNVIGFVAPQKNELGCIAQVITQP
jgi:hypothetical protein